MKRKVSRFIKDFINILRQPEMLVLPGQLAFFFIMSIVPILTLISYGATAFNLSIDFISNFLTKVFSYEIAKLIIPSVSNPTFSVGFIITILIGFIMASNGAASIIVTSNTIYGIKDRGFLRRRIKSIIMTIFIVILFLFILIVPLFGNIIIESIQSLNIKIIHIRQIELFIRLLNGPISWLIIFIFIKILYTMAPDTKVSHNHTTYGAIFATFGWIIVTTIYSSYINTNKYYSVFYGSLANIIILMLWVYLLAIIFTVGLALNYKNDKELTIITKNKKNTIENNNIRNNK